MHIVYAHVGRQQYMLSNHVLTSRWSHLTESLGDSFSCLSKSYFFVGSFRIFNGNLYLLNETNTLVHYLDGER